MLRFPVPSMSLPAIDPSRVLRRSWAINPVLTLLLLAMLVTTVGGVVGMLLDPRLVLNAPTWAKTTKFSISLVLYSATLLWMLPSVTSRPRLARFTGTMIGASLIGEMVLIILQGARARPAHFNVATPFDTNLWLLMTYTILVLFALNLLGLWLVLRQRMPDRVLAWGIRLGVLIMLVGLGQGFLMTSPTSDQTARLAGGETVDLIGAHTVGAPDGGPGLPLLGWSTTRGDLRIGHFVGLHGLQTIPLLAVLVARRRERWLGERHRLALVAIGGAGYLGLVALVTWQALRGQPLLAPDALTLAALGGLVLAAGAAAAATLLHARSTQHPAGMVSQSAS